MKGIAKRAAKDTAKAAIGVDQLAVNQQADRSQDRDHSVNNVIGSFVQPQDGGNADQSQSHKKAGS